MISLTLEDISHFGGHHWEEERWFMQQAGCFPLRASLKQWTIPRWQSLLRAGHLASRLWDNISSALHGRVFPWQIYPLLGGTEGTSNIASITVRGVVSCVLVILPLIILMRTMLQREHESIRSGKGMGEFLTAEDYKKMEYTQQVCEICIHGPCI